MESCAPANQFFRHYLLRGAIGSKQSWPSTGRALYDFFSFLEALNIDWLDVERGEAKSLVAADFDHMKPKNQATHYKPAEDREKDLRLALYRIQEGRSHSGETKISIAAVARAAGISMALIHSYYPNA